MLFFNEDRQSHRQAYCDVPLGRKWDFLFPGVVLQSVYLNSQYYEQHVEKRNYTTAVKSWFNELAACL